MSREAQSPCHLVLDSTRSHGHVIFDMKAMQRHAQGVTPCVAGFNNFALVLSANDHQKICAAHTDDTDPVNREPLLYVCSASSGLSPTQLRSSITSDSQRCAADRSHVTKRMCMDLESLVEGWYHSIAPPCATQRRKQKDET
jgi:hypothetical protein